MRHIHDTALHFTQVHAASERDDDGRMTRARNGRSLFRFGDHLRPAHILLEHAHLLHLLVALLLRRRLDERRLLVFTDADLDELRDRLFGLAQHLLGVVRLAQCAVGARVVQAAQVDEGVVDLGWVSEWTSGNSWPSPWSRRRGGARAAQAQTANGSEWEED